MEKNKFKIYIVLFAVALLSGFFYFKNNIIDVKSFEEEEWIADEVEIKEIKDTKKYIEIGDGDTYGKLMSDNGFDYYIANDIYEASKELYDLVKIRVGKRLELVFEKETDVLKKIIYKIDSEDELQVVFNDGDWIGQIKEIEYEIEIVSKKGVIESSMYQAALESGIDERAIIELANAFAWTIDFAMDPRVGDEFEFVYEERYFDGEYKMPSRVLAGKYTNSGQEYLVYYFEESDDNKGYFDEDGNSVQKMFLKAPVAFKYISSGFTTGSRYIKAFNISTGHRAIDYAAPMGTPIRAVGDGVITYAGWKNSYGNTVKIRHNGTYGTNYCHISKFAVKRGARVSQGDVIAYVGSTGLSTGPHLHYEMVKNGIKINPLKEVLPPGKPIKEENKERFFSEIKKLQEMMGD